MRIKPTYWKTGLCLLGLILLAVVSYRIAARRTFITLAQTPLSAQPFTMEYWTSGRKPGTSEFRVTEMRTVARRSDGSEAIVGVPTNGSLYRNLFLADGSASSLLPNLGVKVSGFFTNREFAARKERIRNLPLSDCAAGPNEKVLRKEQVLGYESVVVESMSQDGVDRDTEWRIPKFGCVKIKSIFESKRWEDGSFRRYAEVNPVYLVEGEPNPVLFERSDSYKEMRPSEAKQAFLRARGLTEQECPSCFDNNWDQRKDAAYLSRQTKQ